MIKCNGIEIKPLMFSDNTSQIWRLPDVAAHELSSIQYIDWQFENESELIHVAQLNMLLRELYPLSEIHLNIPYFPFARQDKQVSNTSTFALRSFCKLLRELDFDKINTIDLHSKVATEYFPQQVLEDRFPSEAIDLAVDAVKPDFIIFPDMGAQARYKTYLPVFEGRIETATIIKTRNQLTGDLSITGINISSPRTLQGTSCLMIDDIADGGRTFISGKEYLDKFNIKELSLYTTHGIYSKGTNVLFNAGIKRIFNLYGEVTDRT